MCSSSKDFIHFKRSNKKIDGMDSLFEKKCVRSSLRVDKSINN